MAIRYTLYRLRTYQLFVHCKAIIIIIIIIII